MNKLKVFRKALKRDYILLSGIRLLKDNIVSFNFN